MIYFFTGNDHKVLMKKKQDLILALQKKQPEASYIRLDTDEVTEETLRGVLETQGLFVDKKIISLSQVCDHKEGWEVLNKKLKELQTPETIVLWSEVYQAPLAPLKKKIEKIKSISEKVIEANKAENQEVKTDPNLFQFAEAFFLKNKKDLWVEFQKVREEVPDGDITLNMILWQIRAVLQANGRTPEEAGLKSFVHGKAQKILSTIGIDRAKDELVALTKLAQEMRMDKKKGYLLLEQYILER